MAVPEGKVSILGSVNTALRAYAQNPREAAVAGALAAVLITLFEILEVSIQPLSPLWMMATWAISALVYAGLIGLALEGPADLSNRVRANGVRVLGAFAVMAIFLFIVSVLVAIAAMSTLIYASSITLQHALQAATVAQDQARAVATLQAMAVANPGLAIAIGAIASLIWMVLTSRLYLAIPTTYQRKRIQTFETWRWTNGNLIRIAAARLLLLIPTYVLISLASALAAVALGLASAPLTPEAMQGIVRGSPAQYAVLRLFQLFMMFGIYYALEAALSVEIFKRLRPANGVPRA